MNPLLPNRLGALLPACLLLGRVLTASAAPTDFDREIRPIFESRCVECHGAQKQKGGVRFDRKASVFKGGDSGKPVLLAGKSSDSLLLQKILSRDTEEMMPPKGERLTDAQAALLRSWIDQGAAWPDDAEKKHWAYVKPVRPSVPVIGGSVISKSVASGGKADARRTGSLITDPLITDYSPKNPIDAFVLARLDKEGLKPSPEADRAVLLRRVSLDLIGLPPTLPEVDAFLADRSADAFEKVVDRLLASPHYGERWARPWLDLARYADTQGYEKDSRRTIWPYRDWVIHALNRDLPFDQFTLEQLAGDLLPDATIEQKVATGFHRNTMTNTEGGTDNEEFRYEALIDRVNTTMQVWMGTTMACAQCHNHKYDPITAREYYQFMAFLNNTADADSDDEKPTMKVPTPAQEQQLRALRTDIATLEKKFQTEAEQPETIAAQAAWEAKASAALNSWQVLDAAEFHSAGGATLTKTGSKSIQAGGTNPKNDTYTVTAQVGPGRVTGFRLEALETGKDKALGRHENGGFVLMKFEVTAKAGDATQSVAFKQASADFSQDGFNVTNLIAGTGQGWAVAAFEKKNKVRRSAYFTAATPLVLAQPAMFVFTLKHSDQHPGANLLRFRLSTTSAESVGPPSEVPEPIRALVAVAPAQRTDKQKTELAAHYRSIASELKVTRDALAARRKTESDLDKSIPITSVMVELEKPRQTRIHLRGGYLSVGDEVATATPAAFHSFPENQPRNRIGLARWLTDTNNPLTARVVINRFWEQYFGHGLVETCEEFGSQGDAPTHPELLDWLATEFMGRHWSMKAAHKLIVMSATYRQSSKVSPDLLQRDPDNRLFARGPRVRLEAEMIRDQMLAVSGLLSLKIGGPSVMPPQPDGLWQVVYSGDKWETSKGEDRYRRGLYTFWRRTSPHPAMTTFDAPSREFCVLKRSRSNTPLQALTTLNDPAAIEAAQALARKIAAAPGDDVKARATLAFRLCLARAPQEQELNRLVKLFETELRHYQQDKPAAGKMATSELGPVPDGLDPATLAAWTVVANVLLNLDETITKG